MVRMYSTRCATKRWPVGVWCNILDLAAQNSWIIYKKINRKENKSKTVHTRAGRGIEIAAHTS